MCVRVCERESKREQHMAGARRRASASEMAAIKGPYDVDSWIERRVGQGKGGNQLPSHMNYDKLLM